jgi:fucose permease
VQGITLVTFPAAATIFTDPDRYDLSNSQYGAMFLPQVFAAIVASLLGSRLASRLSAKRVLLLGLTANLASMGVLVVSATVSTDTTLAYPLLLLATAFLGAGFGLTAPVLNTFVVVFQPDRADHVVLILNALLGLGTATAPVFVAVFVGLGFWWGLPVLSAVLLLLLLLGASRLPLRAEVPAAAPTDGTTGVPAQFWLFAAFALLYGVCETMNGNWSQTEMTSEVGASTTSAALALTAFWAMVTVGRLLFGAIGRWVPARVVYHVLPLLLIGTFLLTAELPRDRPELGILVFGLAGLGCSALLPLTISLGQGALSSMSAAVAGGVIAFYQIGYGVAAFGMGPLIDNGTSVAVLYRWTAVVAAGLAVLSFLVTRRRPAARTDRSTPSGVS